MKHTRFIKTFSMILMLVLLFTGMPVFAVPQTEQEIEPFVLPDIISQAEAREHGYMARVTEEEKDLNTLVFRNTDGSRTLRYFSHPVKYTDANGRVKDITLKLNTQADGSFITADNNIISHFSKHLSDGISLQHQDVNVTMVPLQQHNPTDISLAPIPVGTLQNNVVSYPFFTNTKLEYALTYTGFKEEIVVEQYTGQTEYSFLLSTGGLTLVEDGGEYYLADGEGERKANIGQVIIFTADERNNAFGSMSHVTVREDQQYILTIHVDADYLADPNTAYPIRIDPTIEVAGPSAIEDVTISTGGTYSGTSGSLHVGRTDEGNVLRSLMRFPNLEIECLPGSMGPAYIEIRDIMCQTNEDIRVECVEYSDLAPTWSEASTVTWNTPGELYLGDTLRTLRVSYGAGNSETDSQAYRFHIVNLVDKWASGTADPAKGVVFKAEDGYESNTTIDYHKTFGSYNRSSYKPSLTVCYEYHNLLAGYTWDCSDAEFSGSSTTWTSSDTSVATVNSNGVVTGVSYGEARITATKGGKSAYVDMWVYDRGTDEIITAPTDRTSNLDEGEGNIYRFTPTVTDYYSFYTKAVNKDVMVTVYDNASLTSVLVSNDNYYDTTKASLYDSSIRYNACVCTELTAGTTYYILMVGYDNTVYGNIPIRLHRGLPQSGSEEGDLFDEFNDWSHVEKTNCYAYALCIYDHPLFIWNGVNPGRFSNDYPWTNEIYTSLATCKEIMLRNVSSDLQELEVTGDVMYECSAYQRLPEGYYKVALLLMLDDDLAACDYHWYRQTSDTDGRWGHVPGIGGWATFQDGNNEDIYVPHQADWGDYTDFVCYFAIKSPV